jgi:oligopeptide transport system ATP-binding protein
MEPLLELQSLSKDFKAGGLASGRRIRALDEVSLSLYPGETLGLAGESGCGKTTLARCSLLLSKPTSGSVRFAGCELTALSPAALRSKRREFQIIFQDPFTSLDPRMTVADILIEPFAAHGQGTREQRKAWITSLLESVALDDTFLDRKPRQLSGGQQQRIGIARALALNPRLVFADEPVSALDPSVQAQILNLLAELRKRLGLTLVLISHSLSVVRYLCSRVAIMYLGRIVEQSPVEEFFSQPLHPYSTRLLESMLALQPERRKTTSRPAGDMPSLGSRPPGCAFHPRCAQAIPLCRERSPELLGKGNGRKVACHLYD